MRTPCVTLWVLIERDNCSLSMSKEGDPNQNDEVQLQREEVTEIYLPLLLQLLLQME